MKKIYFRNSEGWANPYAMLISSKSNTCEKFDLAKLASVEYSVDFDNEMYDHLYFAGEAGVRSSKIYPGSLSIGVEYKHNLAMDKDLTYIYSNSSNKTGRVDNYTLVDESNLSHREDKSKKISVYIPDSYDGITPHDILYFFDAQNLFSDAGHYTDSGDPYGSWQLDVVLSEINRQYGKNIIVVGVDNADAYRSQELFMNPSDFGKLSPLATAIPEDDFSRGYLEGLSSFMIETLHPFIKGRYCVKEDNIGLGGSSMGGIATFYCGLRELGFYKYLLSYSPAYGLYDMSAFENYFKSKDFKCKEDILPKIHIYCGIGDQLEEMLLPSAKAMKKCLVSYGYNENKIFETYDEEKPHNEESWRLILPQSFSILFDF